MESKVSGSKYLSMVFASPLSTSKDSAQVHTKSPPVPISKTRPLKYFLEKSSGRTRFVFDASRIFISRPGWSNTGAYGYRLLHQELDRIRKLVGNGAHFCAWTVPQPGQNWALLGTSCAARVVSATGPRADVQAMV